MWTNWQNTEPKIAQTYITQLQTAKLLGRATELDIAGVKTRFNSSLPQDSENMSLLIAELQEYCWQVACNGWDWQAAINPRAQRAGVTRQRYC